MEINPLLLMDFYKAVHRDMIPKNMTKSVSYFTPRMSRVKMWPEVFESYKRTCDDSKVYPYTIHDLMGRCDSGPDPNEQKPYIANLHAQLNYGRDGKRYTNYEALYQSLEHLRQIMLRYKYSSVAFPYKMSSDRGGADWNVVLAMIESVFKDTDVTIEIWSLNGYTGCN